MGGRGREAASRLRKAARKIASTACGSFSIRSVLLDPVAIDSTISGSSVVSPTKGVNALEEVVCINTNIKGNLHSKNLCAICLDPLGIMGSSPGKDIFTAQCSHAFHFACISSNVHHGNVTCPICRAHWTHLPRHLNFPNGCNQNDPILQILDDSIANFRVHRRSILRSARYDDDDPIEPAYMPNYTRLDISLVPIEPGHMPTHPSFPFHTSFHHLHHLTSSSSSLHPLPDNSSLNGQMPYISAPQKAYLSVKLAQQQAIDLVLVASSNGPHLRLLKQSMALVVFSLRHIDRLAIVTYSSAAARIFPLKRMTSYGKRTALQVIDRIFYMGQADPNEGIKKGIKILEDRVHKNPQFCILHLSDSPTRSYHPMNMQMPIPIHRFHVGFGFGISTGFVMHKFEEFLARLLGGIVRDIQLRIKEEARIIRFGELRAGEEKRIVLELGECRNVCIGYSYVEGGIEECIQTGETVVSIEDKRERSDDSEIARGDTNIVGRISCVENWEYHDPFMARRWAKHLHGYRL